eukprot:scaffold96304_cov32-Tisochrysis_lutea.AAC.2
MAVKNKVESWLVQCSWCIASRTFGFGGPMKSSRPLKNRERLPREICPSAASKGPTANFELPPPCVEEACTPLFSHSSLAQDHITCGRRDRGMV